MAYSYTRQSTISDGDTITAALFNNEYSKDQFRFVHSTTPRTSQSAKSFAHGMFPEVKKITVNI